MKLLLASNGPFLVEEGYEALGIPKDAIRIGYVTTASKAASDTSYIERHKQRMIEHGLDFEEIDIEDKSEKELRDFFNDKNVVHMEGGDTFYLLQAIKESGFDKLLKELVDNGLIYVGTSAGSSIVGPTIEFSSHLPENATQRDLTSLGWVPFLIKAHYTDDKEAEYKAKLESIKQPVKFLRDGQGLLIEDGNYKLLGSGEEVRL